MCCQCHTFVLFFFEIIYFKKVSEIFILLVKKAGRCSSIVSFVRFLSNMQMLVKHVTNRFVFFNCSFYISKEMSSFIFWVFDFCLFCFGASFGLNRGNFGAKMTTIQSSSIFPFSVIFSSYFSILVRIFWGLNQSKNFELPLYFSFVWKQFCKRRFNFWHFVGWTRSQS